MMRQPITNGLRCLCVIIVFCLCCSVCLLPASAEFTYYSDRNKTTTAIETTTVLSSELATDVELSRLQDQYEKLENKIQEGEQAVKDVNDGKKTQSDNIQKIQSNINDLNGQIDVLESRVSVLNSDITKLNSSITVLNEEIVRLNSDISELEDQIYETTKTTEILYSKVRGRLLVNYMSGPVSNLEFLMGVRDLPTLFTKLEIIRNLSRYDNQIRDEYKENLAQLQSMNAELSADKSALDGKETTLSGEKNTLSARQADMESSQYVLDMKKKLSEHKYTEAVDYLHTLDETSDEYGAMLNLLNKEQDKVDAQINAYLLKYGSSADDAQKVESVTSRSGDGDSITTTQSAEQNGKKTTKPIITAYTGTVTKSSSSNAPDPSESDLDLSAFNFGSSTTVKVVSPETITLIWPLPYKNCYISAYYGQYPHGGEHHGLDICVRGGTEGKNVVAAADGTVIQYGFNHWSMGNYIIIDHGSGLFTAYYHLQRLYVQKGDHVQQGQTIGLAGHTGNTTGPHLHFEVRISRGGAIVRMNPLKFVSMPK